MMITDTGYSRAPLGASTYGTIAALALSNARSSDPYRRQLSRDQLDRLLVFPLERLPAAQADRLLAKISRVLAALELPGHTAIKASR